LNTIELISDNHLFYGCRNGDIGLIDLRKINSYIWSPANCPHKEKISDILKIGNDVITADAKGSIAQWKS
jgi:hypothetical protein